MMPSILICDDNPIQCRCLEHLLQECPPWDQWPVLKFSSVRELLEYSENMHPASVLLMDICLEDGNGIDAVAALQKICPEVNVIYITGEINYCTDVYETNHCGFLVKPVSLLKLRQALRRTQKSIATARTLRIRVGRKIVNIRLDTVLYLEKQLRKVVVVTTQGKYDFYGRFEDVQPQMDRRMIRCHNSFIANMDYARQFTPDGFLLENDQVVPVSRRRLTAVRNEFVRYLHEKNRETK